jgi:hypothetical protein
MDANQFMDWFDLILEHNASEYTEEVHHFATTQTLLFWLSSLLSIFLFQ